MGLQLCVARCLGVCLFGFGRVISDRVHLKVYFYILWHFTLARGVGVTKVGVRGLGGHPPSQVFTIMLSRFSLV